MSVLDFFSRVSSILYRGKRCKMPSSRFLPLALRSAWPGTFDGATGRRRPIMDYCLYGSFILTSLTYASLYSSSPLSASKVTFSLHAALYHAHTFRNRHDILSLGTRLPLAALEDILLIYLITNGRFSSSAYHEWLIKFNNDHHAVNMAI